MVVFFGFMNSGGGYGNALSFKNIDDNDIAYIEEKVRSNGSAIQTQLDDSVDMNCQANDNNLIEIFGKVHASDPSKFYFERGDRLLIKEIVKHVKGMVDVDGVQNSGLKRFQYKIKTKKSKRPQAVIDPETKNEINNPENNDRYVRLKADLLRLVSACMEQHVECTDQDMVDVHMDSTTDQVYGTILCAMCIEQNKKNLKPHRVYYFESPSRSYWVLSNYHKHLNKFHCIKSTQHIHSERRGRKKRTSVIANEVVSPKTNYEDAEIYLVDDTGHLIPESVEKKISTKEATCNVTIDDYDRLLFDQFSSQIVQMAEATLENSDPQELMTIKLENKTISLTVANIPGDGFCLFGALAHQLFRHPINSPQHKRATKTLKSEVVEYILAPENFSNFEFILKDRVYDMKHAQDITDMRTECKLFVRLSLGKVGWGGAETIQAVSEKYKLNIFIFNEDDTCYIYNNTHKYEQTVGIAYRLGYDKDGNITRNHYDSVCDMDADDIYTATNFTMNRIK